MASNSGDIRRVVPDERIIETLSRKVRAEVTYYKCTLRHTIE